MTRCRSLRAARTRKIGSLRHELKGNRTIAVSWSSRRVMTPAGEKHLLRLHRRVERVFPPLAKMIVKTRNNWREADECSRAARRAAVRASATPSNLLTSPHLTSRIAHESFDQMVQSVCGNRHNDCNSDPVFYLSWGAPHAGRSNCCVDFGAGYAIAGFEVLHEQGRSTPAFWFGAHLLAWPAALLGRDTHTPAPSGPATPSYPKSSAGN